MKVLTTKEKTAEVEQFVKEAFCVDGSIRTVFRDVSLKDHPCFEIDDKERGKFVVIIQTPTQEGSK